MYFVTKLLLYPGSAWSADLKAKLHASVSTIALSLIRMRWRMRKICFRLLNPEKRTPPKLFYLIVFYSGKIHGYDNGYTGLGPNIGKNVWDKIIWSL